LGANGDEGHDSCELTGLYINIMITIEWTKSMKINKQELLASLPPEWTDDLLPQIQDAVKSSDIKIVVLDDDPTGTQTVSDVTVLTRWDVDTLSSVLREPEVVVYILTNSRSFSLDRAQEMNREIARNLVHAGQLTGRPFSVVSRSDSTLRGHFPDEVEALVQNLGQEVDGILVIPFFEEGGRLTINDTHYVAEGEMLVPAGDTEYAKDATFGYTNSDLRLWVSEKSHNRIKSDEVASIGLVAIRRGGAGMVADVLLRLKHGQVCVVNAASYRDMEVFVAGLLQAELTGKRFVYRTAASFVRVRGGMGPRPLLTEAELGLQSSRRGGLIVAGSYILRSSEQISAMQAMPNLTSLEVSVPKLLDVATRPVEINQVSRQADNALDRGVDVLIYTSRELITGGDALSSLQIGKSVSEAIVNIVRSIQNRPAWMIAKGGVTSSNVATQGLDVYRARVIGQLLPGVPVWKLGPDSRWPGLIYVVFPGNVGGPEAIAEVARRLRSSNGK
jgi:uncharacterized protein YgbK (DUF1537 family)